MRKSFLVSFIIVLLLIIFFASDNYDEILGGDVLIDKNDEVDISEPVVINFSRNVFEKDLSNYISISPHVDVDYSLGDGKNLVITPEKGWALGVEYNINVDGIRNFMLAEVKDNLAFSTRRYPKIEAFYPEDDSKNVVIDIEDPIRIKFESPLDDFKIKLDVEPRSEVAYSVTGDKKELSFIFKDGYQKGEKYTVGVYIRHKKEGGYKKIHESYFETEIPPVEEWSSDFKLRLEQAKRFTRAKIQGGKYIDINLKKQILSIFDNGKVVDSFLISSGKRGMDTPVGSFQIANKHPRPWSKKYSLFMPYWMAIVPSGKFGIHELPEWPSGYKEGQNHLGIPVSHGCVRLGVGDAERVYQWADIGTPVIVY